MFKQLLLCTALIHGSSLLAFSASVTLQPSEDTSLFETSPDDNLGSSDLASGTTSAGLKSRALIWFDFAGKVPANATITSVELSFRVTKAPPSAVTSTFGLHRVLQDWAEGTKKGGKIGAPATAGETTWNARIFPDVHWSAPGAAAPADFVEKTSGSRSIAGLGNYTFPSTSDLVADVQSWVTNPQSNFGWILISQSEGTPRTARRLGSSENPSTAPSLVIQFNAPAQAAPPTIDTQPQNQTVAPGTSVTFNIIAVGTEPLGYQWKFNGADIPGATSPNLTISNVQASNAGSYTARVQNSGGSVTSAAAVLAVQSLPPPPPLSRNRWTIMIYGHADHNLTGSLVADMQEMEASGSGPDFNVVVQADFDASSPQNAAGGLPADLAKGVTRFLIQKDTDPNTITSTAVERLPELNMDDPAVLTGFVTWAAQKYPADRYGLILWNHGGQWQGFGGDSQDGTLQDRGSLTTAQLRKSLSSAMQTASIAKWDFISFDTCLMGGAEVLTDFVPLTDVFIACPEIDYGDGWDYAASFNFLKANPAVSAMDFGRAEVQHWEAHHLQPGKDADLNLAAHTLYDLTKYAAFEEKFNAFSTLLRQSATPQNLSLPRVRLDTTQYSLSGVKDIGKPTDFVDVGELADRVAADASTDPALKTAALNMVSSIDTMVVAKVRGTKKQLTHGLSVYYPIEGAKDNQNYLALSLSSKPGSAWSQFLAKVTENKSGDNVAPDISNGDVALASLTQAGASPASFSASVAQPANIRVKVVNGSDAYSMQASIVDNHFTVNTNDYVYLGELLFAPVNGVGTYNIQWSGTLPMLSSATGTNAAVLGGFFDDLGSDIMVSYAEYVPPKSTDTQIVALLTQIKGNKGEVINVLDAEVEELAPAGIDIEAGGTLTPLYYMERRQGNDPDKWQSDDVRSKSSIVIPPNRLKGLTVNMAQLPNGIYTMEVQVADVYENESDVLEYAIAVGQSQQAVTLSAQALAGGKIKVSWPASATGYILETNSALASGGWIAVASNQVATEGASNAFTDSLSGESRFYRLRKN